MKKRMMRRIAWLAHTTGKATPALAAVAAGAYAAVVRPRLLRWGATADGLHMVYPGQDLFRTAHAVPRWR